MTTHHGPTVLIVEDDRGTREMFDYALRVTGFRVVSVADGYAALRVIEQDLPDVIVLDLDLPQVSGMDVHEEVTAHAETSVIPIIVVTGTEWDVPKTAFRILRKPISSDVLIDAIQQALSSRREPPLGHHSRR
jgi:DNA-binding response OmpR family regulator